MYASITVQMWKMYDYCKYPSSLNGVVNNGFEMRYSFVVLQHKYTVRMH